MQIRLCFRPRRASDSECGLRAPEYCACRIDEGGFASAYLEGGNPPGSTVRRSKGNSLQVRQLALHHRDLVRQGFSLLFLFQVDDLADPALDMKQLLRIQQGIVGLD